MHIRRLTALAAIPGVLAIAACDPVPPNASPEACRGLIRAIEVEQVVVPQGATCTLEGTVVDGSVLVRRDATLIARAEDD